MLKRKRAITHVNHFALNGESSFYWRPQGLWYTDCGCVDVVVHCVLINLELRRHMSVEICNTQNMLCVLTYNLMHSHAYRGLIDV